MSATGTRRRLDGPQRNVMVRLVCRLIVAQAALAAAVGLLFGRRHVPSILITLSLVVVVCLLAALARTGTRAAWLAAFGFEAAFFLFGLSRFVTARYVGGTLLALVVAGTLAHPAVARAYNLFPDRGRGEMGLPDAAADALRERATG